MKRLTITATQPPRNPIKINRPFSTAPEIAEEYTEDGVRYKKAVDGRIFKAEIYEKLYQVKPIQPKKNGFKGAEGKPLPVITRANNLKRFANG